MNHSKTITLKTLFSFRLACRKTLMRGQCTGPNSNGTGSSTRKLLFATIFGRPGQKTSKRLQDVYSTIVSIGTWDFQQNQNVFRCVSATFKFSIFFFYQKSWKPDGKYEKLRSFDYRLLIRRAFVQQKVYFQIFLTVFSPYPKADLRQG